MYLDNKLLYSKEQKVQNSSTSGACYTGNMQGAKNSLELFFAVVEAFDNLTELSIDLESANDKDFNDKIDHGSLGVLLLEDLQGGEIHFAVRLPKDCKNYTRLVYTVVGTAPTKGQITAGYVLDAPCDI